MKLNTKAESLYISLQIFMNLRMIFIKFKLMFVFKSNICFMKFIHLISHNPFPMKYIVGEGFFFEPNPPPTQIGTN